MAGLFITGLGAAGIKPTVLSLGRQQFDYTDPVEKEKGILFFSYYYAVFEASLLLATTVFFWLQTDVGFKEGYSTMAGTFYAGIIISLFGIRYLRYTFPSRLRPPYRDETCQRCQSEKTLGFQYV